MYFSLLWDCEKDGSGMIIWRVVRSVLALAWTIKNNHPADLPSSGSLPLKPLVLLLSDDFRKYSFAIVVPGSPRATKGSRQSSTQFLKLETKLDSACFSNLFPTALTTDLLLITDFSN